MPKTEISQGDSEQTKLNRRLTRRYRLSPGVLIPVQNAARRRRLWEKSTGPRTEAGKPRSKLNATKHGLFSAATRAELRELSAYIRQARQRVTGCLDGSVRDA